MTGRIRNTIRAFLDNGSARARYFRAGSRDMGWTAHADLVSGPIDLALTA